MTKRATALPPALAPRDSNTPAYLWLGNALRTEILEGRLRPDARLPATRDLARQYGLSRGTIVSAFDQLKSEGYLQGTVGSGTYVNKSLPEDFLHVHRKQHGRLPSRSRQRRSLSDQALRMRAFPRRESQPTRAFRANQPALDLFPTDVWGKLAGRRIRNATASQLLGCGPLGYAPLQEAIAAYLRASRGVNCVADQVVVVSGAQEALDLAARVFLNPGDQVCIENPGYVGAALVFEAYGAKIVPLSVDDEGMKLPGRKLRGARLAYVTPAHQFPLGVSMSLPRRLALLEWARDSGAMIFEDDYDSEFRYSGRPLPSLQGLDRSGVVLFTGSFSKVLFPSIRLGYLVVPLDVVDHIAAIKSVTSRHASVLEQVILCDFIADGHFGRHVRRMREIYAERLGALMDGARKHLSGLIEISSVEAGLQTVGWLARGIDGESAEMAAAARDVEVTPLSRYAGGKFAQQGLQLGFAAVDSREIHRGVRDLAIALEKLKR